MVSTHDLKVGELMDEPIDNCMQCGAEAMATTPRGRMCGGHALLETTREWNQGNWTWTAHFDSSLLNPPRITYSQLIA